MIGWAAETLVATTLLLAVVMILRRPVARIFGARAAYALWLAPFLRLVAPPLAMPVEAPTMWIETSGAAAAMIAAPDAGTVSAAAVMMSFWIAGAALFLLYHLFEYRRFLSDALADARPFAEPGISDAAILATPAVGGPAAAGLLNRRIFLPEGFERDYDAEERRLALMHEALHHRRGDLWATSLALAMLALHWFNPVAHVAYRAFRRDQEAACDAELLARTGPGDRASYARAIVRSATRPMPHAACALTHVDEVKGRLKMMKVNPGLIRRSTGAALALALAAGGLTLAVPAVAEPQAGVAQPAPPEAEVTEEKIVRVRKIMKDGKEVSSLSPELREKMAKCEGEVVDATAEVEGSDGKRKAVVKLCGKPGSSKAELAAMVEKALGRIESDSEMPADSKAAIVAQLRARIAALRAGQ